MKRKLLILMGVLLLGLPTFWGYRAFHDPEAFIVKSPASDWWAVDFLPQGWCDIGLDFRAHDLRSNLLNPVAICDLHWQGGHYPVGMQWSKDGTVAAVLVGFMEGKERLYEAAYDFREHCAHCSSPFLGSPLEPSLEISKSIKELLAARGGAGELVTIPDATKRGFYSSAKAWIEDYTGPK